MTSHLQRLYSASPMPLKAIGLGLLCGMLTWAILNLYESPQLSQLLLAQTADRLNNEASSHRMLFHRFLKQHVQLTRLIASYQPLVTWLDQRQAHPPAEPVTRYERQRPDWFPPVSAWRGIIHPDLFLLHDSAGNLRAVYRLSGNELPLDSALRDTVTNGRSDGQIHLLALAGNPHLVTSSTIKDAYGRRLGSLALISRIDDEFVARLNHASDAPNVILGLFEGGAGRLVASNQPTRFAKGVRLKQLKDDYLTTGKPFFDYGASELRLQLATLIPLEKTAALNATILQTERGHHLLAALAFTLSFSFLIFYWSRRIESVLRQIHGFSQHVIGESREFRVRGDALWQLEEDFIRLRDELFGARDQLRQQQAEMERLRQLELLESVAEHLGIGVVLLGPEGEVALKTQRVERLEATLGEDWYRPSLGWSAERRQLVLEGARQRPFSFTVTRLSLFREDDVVLYQDVTEQMRLRRRLHEQELQLHRVTQSARDAIVSIDAHGNVAQWNRAAESLFQHSALEVLGRPVTRIMPAAYREAHRSALRRTATSGDAHLVGKTLELEGLRKDGTTISIELSLSSFDYQGDRFFSSIIRDISERKRTEKALQASQSRFSAFMNHLPAAVFIKAASGRVFFVNDYLKSHFGKKDLPAKTSAGDDLGEVIEQLSCNDQMVLTEGWYEMVRPLEDAAGQERTFRIHNFAIAEREGEETLLCGIAWDITDTVTAAKALRSSERRYRRIFETAEEGIWLVDPEGNTLEANERMGRMLGCTDYEMMNHQMFEFMDDPACDAAEVLLDRCRQGIDERRDLRFRTATGADLWTIVSSTPMHDTLSGQIGVLMMITDITERKRAEEKLRAQEERLRLTLASTGEGIFGLDMNGCCTFANRACIELLGFANENDLLGKKIHELIHHTRRDGTHYPVEECPTYRSCNLRAVTYADDELLWRADGNAFHAEYQSFPMLQDGSVVGAVVSFADITERKLAADLLEYERDFAENLIETAPAIVLVLDAGGRILRFNSFMENLSGYSLAEVKGQSWLDTFLVGRDIPQAAQDFARARYAVLEVHCEHHIVTRAGRERLISWYVKDLERTASEGAGLLAIGLDVTEERAREAQLIQAQKMETVGQLTDGVAHDFNNLLTVILGNLKLLGGLIDAKSDPTVSEILEDAVSAGRDGAELTQRLLAFSRQEPPRRKRFDLTAFLHDFERFLRRTMRSDIVIQSHIGTQLGQILGDPPQLQSALLNLALNARDAMPNGGEIDFEAELRQVDNQHEGLAPGTYVALSVIDSGAGMTPEQLDQAIQPFYTTKVSGQGSGLGLSMVFRFCEQSGGRFELASELGAGTKATILLPVDGSRDNEAAQKPETAPPVPVTAKGGTVLVVEDEARIRKLARRYLTDLGYDVIIAEDGKKAIEVLESDTTIDLVFSDIFMPGGINGSDLCRWVKEQRPELNVLLTTGLSSERMKRPGVEQELKVPSPLPKPYTKEQLAKAIRDIFSLDH